MALQRGLHSRAVPPSLQTAGFDAASQLFDEFCSADTFHSIMDTFHRLSDLLELRPDRGPTLRQLKVGLSSSWKAQSLWTKLDKRMSHWEYRRGTACTNTRVLVIGAGPSGLRVAIETALLGARVVMVEKRDSFSRNNVLHLWPHTIHDLKALGAKKFFGKFCAGSIDHISIRTLQCILLKVALLVGVEVYPGVSFEGLVEPPADQATSKVGWRARVDPVDHPVSEYVFDVCISADGKRNTLHGFKKKEFRGKLAIAITANFINHNTKVEASVEEISGVSYIFNQKFFKDLNSSAGIDLENIVYYKDETHYFVMTAKKHSLLYKGVLLQDDEDPQRLLSKDNVDQSALLTYAREAADIATRHQLPDLEFAHNHYGQPDVAMFDFTSMYAAENACRVIERQGHRLLVALVGDTLLEPFWPIGSGCARGFLGALDTAWMVRSWASGKMTPLEVIAERESIYQLLSQTTPENLNKSFAQHTIDPNTRYRSVNVAFFRPYQLRGLYDGADVNEIVKQSEQKGRKYDMLRDSHNLLKWFQRQLEPYRNLVKVIDLTTSWRNGLALCSLIHLYRPNLLDVYALNPGHPATNNQLAFDVAEKEFGIAPIMSGYEMISREFIDKTTMVSYVSQFYELFRKESVERDAATKENALVKSHVNSAVSGRSRQRKDDLENNDANSLKRFPEMSSSHGIPSKRVRDVLGVGTDTNYQVSQMTSREPSDVLKDVAVGVRGHNKVSALAKDLADKISADRKPPAPPPAKEPRPNPKSLILGKSSTADVCYFCKERVYIVERYTLRGILFHRNCLRCDYCGAVLRVSSYDCQTLHNGQMKFYCIQHSGLQKLTRPGGVTTIRASRDVSDYSKPRQTPPSNSGPDMRMMPSRDRPNVFRKPPERAEYTTESEVEESEFDQTQHNRCGLLRPTAYSDSDSSSSSEQELQFSDDEDGSEEMPDVSWQEFIRRTYRQRFGVQKMSTGDADADRKSSDTDTVGGASDADDDWETESDTEQEAGTTADQKKEDPAETVERPPAERSQAKSILSSAEIMRNRMAFFSVPSQPVRINARAFLGLESTLPSKPAEDEREVEVKDASEKLAEKDEKPVDVVNEEKSPAPGKESEANRKRHGRREPAERAKRWRKRRKKRRVTGHVTGGAVAEKHAALPVVAIEGASSDEGEDVDLGDDIADDSQEVETENITDIFDVEKVEDFVTGKDEQLTTDLTSEPDRTLRSQDEVVLSEDVSRQADVTGGQESQEETSVTVCDAADDLSESSSEIVEELCVSGDDDDNDNDDADGTEYLADGRTINYDKYFAEESGSREDLDDDELCSEEPQQVVDDVVASFREIGDAQPPTDVVNLPLTQSEERLLMFGWKEGMENEESFINNLEKDVTKDEAAEMSAETERTDEVFRDSSKEIDLEGKDDGVDVPESVVPSGSGSSPTEHKHSYQPHPSSKSLDQTAVVMVPVEKLAPRAKIDSFSDEDLELCVMVPSYPLEAAEVTSNVAVDNKVLATEADHYDENPNLDTSSNLDSLLPADASDSANLSDAVLANISSDVCQPTSLDTYKPEFQMENDVKTSAQENVQISMQSLPQDSGAELTDQVETKSVPLYVDVTGGSKKNEDLRGAASSVLPHSPVTSLSPDSSKCEKLDPVARIDRLLESLSSSLAGPVSPSLLSSDDVFLLSKQLSGKAEISSDFPKSHHPVSPSSRLDRLADTSVSDHAADISDARDESRIVEFKVEDESGAEQSFRVDESFISTRDRQNRQFSEKESLSDVSFSATDSTADHSITCTNADESSSSGTQEIATCPAALMAATDDSLSLDRLASFSFDDVLSTDSVLDDDSYDLADVEGKEQSASAKPICNGTLHDETNLSYKQQRNELCATVVDASTGKDSPPVAVVSPSRLIDAKRRFFCEAPQPVRIDPQRVFDEIPAPASTTFTSVLVPEVGSADNTSRSLSSNAPGGESQQVNGMTSKATAVVNKVSSDVSTSDQPRRRVLPAVPPDQPKLDVSELVLSAEELALIKNSQQRAAQSGERNAAKPAQAVAVDDSSFVRRRLHRTEKKRPSSALVVTATEREKVDSPGRSSNLVRPSPQTSSSTPKPGVPQRQSSHSDSTTDGSPGQRRDRMWAFHRPKSKTKAVGELAGGGDMVNSSGSDRKDKRRSLLALLMPSKGVDRREKSTRDLPPPVSAQPLSAGDATTVEPSTDRTEIIAAVREKTKSLPLEKKKLPAASDAVKRSSLEKQRSKSSKSRGGKKSSEGEGDGRSKPTQRTVYEEMAPIIEGIKRVERRNREKVNIHERIRAVAPPPAKAPFTALLPPKADIDDFETESEFGDDRKSLQSFQSASHEDPAKLARRQQKAARRKQREKELCRLHLAQEIQRQLEEVEQRQREIEQQGIAVEKALRGEPMERLQLSPAPSSTSQYDEAELMQQWFDVVHEKNVLAGYESELVIHARELELEDRQSRLEAQLRERIASETDEKSSSLEDMEQKILHELMEVVQQRDALVALLEEDRLKQQQYDKNLERIMVERGFSMSPVPYLQNLRQPLAALRGDDR